MGCNGILYGEMRLSAVSFPPLTLDTLDRQLPSIRQGRAWGYEPDSAKFFTPLPLFSMTISPADGLSLHSSAPNVVR